MNETRDIRTLCTWNTIYNADSVEWCPIETYYDIFVCGTYHLTSSMDPQNKQERCGRIYLFSFCFEKREMKKIQEVETPGILDQKWSNYLINGMPHLGTVNSEGSLEIFALSRKNENISLTLVARKNLIGYPNLIATSLDWSNNKHEETIQHIAVTDTHGNLTIFKFLPDSASIELISSKVAHSYESWICAFNSWNPNLVLSGGDDCKLKMFDLKCEDKVHCIVTRDMGVTSLHFNNNREYMFASGGYDEILCLWDTRIMKKNIAEISLGGGIWRLKWEPKGFEKILAACMHNGFSVVNLEGSILETEVKYNDHNSLAYGSDWCHEHFTSEDNTLTTKLIATCSFYDCKLNISELNI